MTTRPAPPGVRWPLWAGVVVALLVTVWAAFGIEFTLAPLFTDTLRAVRRRLV